MKEILFFEMTPANEWRIEKKRELTWQITWPNDGGREAELQMTIS